MVRVRDSSRTITACLQLAGALVLASAASACVGVFAAHDTSSSIGACGKGALLHGVAMPFSGTGYEIHHDWRVRDRRYTTLAVARWLTEVFRELDRSAPGSVAYLGDLSAKNGGSSTQHHSHASGRDVDIFYFASDGNGRPIHELPAMLHFAPDGHALRWSVSKVGQVIKEHVPEAYFDVRRNWALVKAMLESRTVEVQWIFVDRGLGSLLLAEGARQGTARTTLARAQALIHQPTDSQPHDDHMHVRLFCDPDGRPMGCSDLGPKRWLKKHWKYLQPAEQVLASLDRP